MRHRRCRWRHACVWCLRRPHAVHPEVTRYVCASNDGATAHGALPLGCMRTPRMYGIYGCNVQRLNMRCHLPLVWDAQGGLALGCHPCISCYICASIFPASKAPVLTSTLTVSAIGRGCTCSAARIGGHGGRGRRRRQRGKPGGPRRVPTGECARQPWSVRGA